MNTHALHPVSKPASHRLVLAALLKVVTALMAAFLLGLALEAIPLSGESWSLPVDPAVAASFTA